MDCESVQWSFTSGTSFESLGPYSGLRFIGNYTTTGRYHFDVQKGEPNESEFHTNYRCSAFRSFVYSGYTPAANGATERVIRV